jgi:hypothetical protein
MPNICKNDLQELDDLFDQKLEVIRTAIKGNQALNEQRFSNTKEALDISLIANNKRLDLLNEFRQQSVTEQTKFLTIAVFEAKHEVLERQHNTLEKKFDLYVNQNSAQSKGINMVYVWIIGAITLISSIVALILSIIRLLSLGQ